MDHLQEQVKLSVEQSIAKQKAQKQLLLARNIAEKLKVEGHIYPDAFAPAVRIIFNLLQVNS